MTPSQTAEARAGLAEYLSCCRRYGHTPTDDEVRGVLAFVLLMNSSGGATMCESVDEVPGWAGRMVVEALHRSHGYSEPSENPFALSIGDFDLGSYVSYFFKRPKVASLLKKELTLELSKVELFRKEVALRRKLAELEGRDDDESARVDTPKLTRDTGSFSSPSHRH